ncbi:hypothetical protein XCR_0479 [Xanthomonas campestris pv. raphani 756C]|nr:hypothetical protein XCR_0479 [Xanthomonas campestris pv. raphani 756C]
MERWPIRRQPGSSNCRITGAAGDSVCRRLRELRRIAAPNS